jgi:hypothetical protein
MRLECATGAIAPRGQLTNSRARLRWKSIPIDTLGGLHSLRKPFLHCPPGCRERWLGLCICRRRAPCSGPPNLR